MWVCALCTIAHAARSVAQTSMQWKTNDNFWKLLEMDDLWPISVATAHRFSPLHCCLDVRIVRQSHFRTNYNWLVYHSQYLIQFICRRNPNAFAAATDSTTFRHVRSAFAGWMARCVRVCSFCESQRIRQIGVRHASEWSGFRQIAGVCVTIDNVRRVQSHAGNWHGGDNTRMSDLSISYQLICSHQTLFLISLERAFKRIGMVCPMCRDVIQWWNERKLCTACRRIGNNDAICCRNAEMPSVPVPVHCTGNNNAIMQ